MTDLPYTYTDVEGDVLRVDGGYITAFGDGSDGESAGVHAPQGAEAATLARAVLAAAGNTEHRVVHVADLTGAENAVIAMRQRAAYLVEYSPDMSRADLVEAIRALPLLDGEEDTSEEHGGARNTLRADLADDIDQLQRNIRHIKGTTCQSFTADPLHPGDALYCDHPAGEGHTGHHYADTWKWADATEPGEESCSCVAAAADLMARAILAAAGGTGHVVIDRADLPSTRQAAYMAAMSMRTRAADAARQAEEHPLYPVSPRAGAVEAIRALPLLPYGDDTDPHGGEEVYPGSIARAEAALEHHLATRARMTPEEDH